MGLKMRTASTGVLDPVTQQHPKVRAVDHAITVQIADRRVVHAPQGDQDAEVGTVDAPVEVEVALGQVAFIRDLVFIDVGR